MQRATDAAALLAWSDSLDGDNPQRFATFIERELVISEINEILAEMGEPPTTQDELDRAGVITIPVREHDRIPVEVTVEVL